MCEYTAMRMCVHVYCCMYVCACVLLYVCVCMCTVVCMCVHVYRQRTKEVYTIYSRKSMEEVHRSLLRLQVTHVVVEPPWCREQGKSNCPLPHVWDLEDHAHWRHPTFCSQVLNYNNISTLYFDIVFHNDFYTVLQVKSISLDS